MSLPFVDENFPVNLSTDMAGVIQFDEVVISTPSGITDLYNLGPDTGKLRYTFDSPRLELAGANMLSVKTFYIGRKYNSFRLLDPVENSVTDESFGSGDGSTVAFQLIKTYESAEKDITKPVSGTIIIKENGVTQTETVDYNIDYDTGIVTFTSAPGAGLPLTWSGTFDIHVRFDGDSINAAVDGRTTAGWTTIELIEEIN